MSESPITLLNFLKISTKMKVGKNLLVKVNAGILGTYNIQIAKYFGYHVTVVCSTTDLKMVKDFETDSAINYKNEDFTKGGFN